MTRNQQNETASSVSQPVNATQRRDARPDDGAAPVAAKLSTLDRFLPVWIGVAMLVGLLLGRAVPSLDNGLARWRSAVCRCRSRSGCW